jgi:hypothetical protein
MPASGGARPIKSLPTDPKIRTCNSKGVPNPKQLYTLVASAKPNPRLARDIATGFTGRMKTDTYKLRCL